MLAEMRDEIHDYSKSVLIPGSSKLLNMQKLRLLAYISYDSNTVHAARTGI